MKIKVSVMVLLFSFVVCAQDVLACPVCFSAKGATLNAFRFSTVFLTVVPLIAFFSFIYWYRKKVKEIDQTHSKTVNLEDN